MGQAFTRTNGVHAFDMSRCDGGPVLSGAKSALCHPHQTAQMAADQRAAMPGNLLKLHGFCAAKNIAAFNISHIRRENSPPDCFLIQLKSRRMRFSFAAPRRF